MRRRPVTAVVLGLAAVLAAPALAQPLAAPQPPVGLDVSLPAAKRLAGARDFVAAGDWDAAITSLESLTEEFGESLIEVEPGRYLNVRLAVAATLARLPPPGLAAYRRRVDPAIQSVFAEAQGRNSPTLMRQVVREGFSSSYGDEALDWLAEEALETGDSDSARRLWTALIPTSQVEAGPTVLRVPESFLTPADVCARLILCSILSGDHVRAEREIGVFQSRYGDVDGQLAGRTGALGGMLAELLAEARRWPGRDATGKLSVSGIVDRGRPDPSMILWSRSLSPGPLHTAPAVWKDVIILPGAFSVRALSLWDGGPRWPSGAAGDDGTIYAELRPVREARPAQGRDEPNTCQVVDERCYLRIGGPTTNGGSQAPTRLVCLDLEAEGRLAWSAGSDEFAEFPGGRFSGPPVVYGSRVFVPVRWGAPQVEVGLACLDAFSGELLWHRRLCTVMDAVPRGVMPSDHDVLAAGGGLVYHLPSGGILAASDAETGELLWAVTYQKSTGPDESPRRSDAASALVYHGGWLFSKPSDSNRLLAVDSGDGRRLWSVEPPSRIRDLLGVASGRLIASGDQLWGFEAPTGRAWRFGFDDPAGYGFGRGAVAGGHIYWPTHDDLFVVEAESGELIGRVLFDPESGLTGGDLAVAGDSLMLVGPAQITALGPAGSD